MRTAALLLLVAARVFAADPDPAGEPHTDVRRQLLSEFRYSPAPADPAPVPLFLAAAAQPPPDAAAAADPDVVEMAPYTVRERVRMEKLRSDLLQEESGARAAMVMSRLGIARHVARVGRVEAYAVTLFYIPFAAGFAW